MEGALQVKDANGQVVQFAGFTHGGKFYPAHVQHGLDAAGNPAPLQVQPPFRLLTFDVDAAQLSGAGYTQVFTFENAPGVTPGHAPFSRIAVVATTGPAEPGLAPFPGGIGVSVSPLGTGQLLAAAVLQGGQVGTASSARASVVPTSLATSWEVLAQPGNGLAATTGKARVQVVLYSAL